MTSTDRGAEPLLVADLRPDLPSTMTAVRWWARGDVRVEQVPVPPTVPAGWILIEVLACGICGTDLEEFLHGPIVVPSTPHPLTGGQAPLILGHETIGRVLVGSGVDTPAVGAVVVVEGSVFCGTCSWCLRHEYPLCAQLASLGQMGDGGLAEFMVAPALTCIEIPAPLTVEQAVLTEPLSVVCRALSRYRGSLDGARVAVFGVGTIGLLTVQAACASGADVTVIDPNADRCALALELGASRCVAPDEVMTLLDRSPGGGPDLAIECAGRPEAAEAAIRLIRPGGSVILVGVHDGDLKTNMLDFLRTEKTLTSSVSHVYDEDVPAALELIRSGKINTAAMITSTIPLSRTVSDGFEALRTPEAQIKVVVVPDRLLG